MEETEGEKNEQMYIKMRLKNARQKSVLKNVPVYKIWRKNKNRSNFGNFLPEGVTGTEVER